MVSNQTILSPAWKCDDIVKKSSFLVTSSGQSLDEVNLKIHGVKFPHSPILL